MTKIWWDKFQKYSEQKSTVKRRKASLNFGKYLWHEIGPQ